MYSYQKLIAILLLVSCTPTTDKDFDFSPIVEKTPVKIEDNSLLESVDSTLDMADEAINDIVNKQQATGRKITQLQQKVGEEERIISNLQAELLSKDSIITNQHQKIGKYLIRINNIESRLDYLANKHTNEYIPTIYNLTQENIQLHNYIDSLEFKIDYMDSLILTNKRLTKTYEYEH